MDHLTFSKIKFESDPFSHVSSRCVIGVSLMSCCWLYSNSMFMKVGVINQRDNWLWCLFGTEVIRFCLIYLESCGKFKP